MKTVIIEDHLFTRDLLRAICARELGHDIIGEATNGSRGMELIRRARPDLVLMGIRLPGVSGFEVIDAIRTMAERPRVLVFSARCDDYTVFRLERARIDGFIDRRTNTVAELRQAIAIVGEGRRYFSDAFRNVKAARQQNPFSFDKVLTDHQQRILAMVGDLAGDREIGERLEISGFTVEKHRSNISRKLGLRTRPALEVYARDHGFTEALVREP